MRRGLTQLLIVDLIGDDFRRNEFPEVKGIDTVRPLIAILIL